MGAAQPATEYGGHQGGFGRSVKRAMPAENFVERTSAQRRRLAQRLGDRVAVEGTGTYGASQAHLTNAGVPDDASGRGFEGLTPQSAARAAFTLPNCVP
jgi:hypothetical protein